MLTDAHCHPFDLERVFPECEKERRRLDAIAAASACDTEELSHNILLSHNAAAGNAAPLLPCFGIHPQIFKIINDKPDTKNNLAVIDKLLETLVSSAAQGKIAAIGECGFDLYSDDFIKTEADQERYFTPQMETALKHDLPLVLHVRRAMHKVFSAAKSLSKCRAVIFHSWPGTYEEGMSLLRRGVNAYFSFGNTVMLNHRQAIRSCALFPAQKILTETDAPYQKRRGEAFSQWNDLPLILETIAALRGEAGNKTDAKELEEQVEANFHLVFNI